MRTRSAVFAMLAACAPLCGCYIEKPLETVPPPPRTHILAQLSDTGTVMLGNALGPGVIAIEGVVESADPNDWRLHMVSTDLKDGRSVVWNGELVNVPPHVLIEPQTRVLDKRKSWLTAGAVVAGSLLAARAFNLIGADDNKDSGPQPQATIIRFGGR